MLCSVFRWLKERLRMASALPTLADPELQSAARQCIEATYPDRLHPPVRFQVWADEGEHFIIAVSNLDPGVLDFVSVAKETYVATLVEDQLKYRPRNLK